MGNNLTHSLYNLSEKLYKHYSEIIEIVLKINDLFKNTHRYDCYYPKNKRPPSVSKTRWNKFLVACCYYDRYFDIFKGLILSKNFDRTSERNRILFELLKNTTIKKRFEWNFNIYGVLIDHVKKSENDGFSIKIGRELMIKLIFNYDPVNLSTYLKERWARNNIKFFGRGI